MLRKICFILVTVAIMIQFSCKSKRGVQGSMTSPTPPTVTAPVAIGGYAIEDIHFKVQIGAFQQEKGEDDDFFTGVIGEEVTVDFAADGLIRYLLGTFLSYQEANSKKDSLKDKEYNEAFVVAYGNDNRRIDLPMSQVARLWQQSGRP